MYVYNSIYYFLSYLLTYYIKNKILLYHFVDMQFVDWIVKQTGKISDNFNDYKFHITYEPQVIDSSSVVSLNTFTSRDKIATVPCTYRWFTIRNGVTTQIAQFKGNTYICEPSDVGCYLQVEITSSDPEHHGTAVVRLGPVKFDVLLKKQLQIGLSAGQSTFYIDLIQKNIIKQCQLKVSQQKISISHLSSQTSYLFNYSLIEPKIQTLHKIPIKTHIIFNPKYHDQIRKFLIRLFGQEILQQQLLKNPFLQINFANRKAKDSFIFTTKAFNTKKMLKTSSYVINLQKQIDFSSPTQSNNKNFDYLQQISSLQYDINKLLQINTKNYKQKRLYLQQNKKLQKQIQQIVSTYLKIIQEKFQGREDFQKSFVVLKEKEEEIRNNKLGNREIQQKNMRICQLEKQNSQLKEIISRLGGGDTPNSKLNSSRMSQSQKQTPPIMTFAKKSNPFLVVQSSSLHNNNSNMHNTSDIHNKSNISNSAHPNQQLKRLNDQLLKQKYQISIKYEGLKKQFEDLSRQLNDNRILQSNSKTTSENLDMFDAKSVKSMKQNNTIQNNNSSLMISKDSLLLNNPQKLRFSSTQSKKPLSLSTDPYTLIQQLKQQNLHLRNQISYLQQSLSQKTIQYQQKQKHYKKKIAQIMQQLQMYRRNNDVLNRSQNLSMEMDQYNQEQQKVLRNQNSYLMEENEKLRDMCKKYMFDAKKYKEMKKSMHLEEGNVVSQ